MSQREENGSPQSKADTSRSDGYLGTVTFFDRRAKMRLPAVRLYSNCGGASHPMVQIKDDRKIMYKEWLDQGGDPEGLGRCCS